MSTSELKKMLVSKINLIEDDAYLLAINTLIDTSLNRSKIFKLNDTQRDKIEESINQVAEGNTCEIDSAFDDIDKWLQKK
jgi:hypothetical protein